MFVACVECLSGKGLSFLPPSSASGQHLVKLTLGERVGLKFLQVFHIQKEVSLPVWEHNHSSVSQHVFCH